MTREELEKLERNQLMGIAKEKGVKKYIFMKSDDLVQAILETEASMNEQGPSIVDECQKFYDELAENNEVEFYAKVDAIVNDRELSELSENELKSILKIRDEFTPTPKADDKAAPKKNVNSKKEKPAGGKAPAISDLNPVLLETKRLLEEGKTVGEIAGILGKSRTYIHKCKAKLGK